MGLSGPGRTPLGHSPSACSEMFDSINKGDYAGALDKVWEYVAADDEVVCAANPEANKEHELVERQSAIFLVSREHADGEWARTRSDLEVTLKTRRIETVGRCRFADRRHSPSACRPNVWSTNRTRRSFSADRCGGSWMNGRSSSSARHGSVNSVQSPS